MARKKSKIDDFAEELGELLGSAQAKAEGWLGQRTQIAKSLKGIRDTASKLLADLGERAQRMALTKRGPGKRKTSSGGPAPKRRKMSAAARARISAAQKARWALKRAADKKK